MQVIVNGLISGATTALLAAAFATVYLPSRVFMVALAGIYSLAPFIAQSFGTAAGGPSLVSLAASLATGVLISISCEALNHSQLDRKGAGPGLHLVSSLGIFIIIIQVISMVWGNEVKVLRRGNDPIFINGLITLTRGDCLAGGVSVLVLVCYCLLFQFSKLGLRFRALAENPVQLALYGHNVRRLRFIAFAIGGFLASGSALLVAYRVKFDLNGGLNALLLAVVATVIGGRQSFWGPVLAGLLLGVLRSEVAHFSSVIWQDAITFLLLVTFLLLRPEGVFGRRIRLEAQE